MKLKIYYPPYILKANQSAIDGSKDLSKAYVIIEEGRIKEYYGYLSYNNFYTEVAILKKEWPAKLARFLNNRLGRIS